MSALHARRPASTADGQIELQVLQQAAEWFALLRSPGVADTDWRDWQHWREADSRHQAAWARVEAISGAFERLPASDKPNARRTLERAAGRQARRRSALKMLGLLCGAGVAGWSASRSAPWLEWNADYRTATGEVRQIELADGGQVWLNTASALDVRYTPTLRALRLHRGEILVQTAKTPPDRVERPFVVDTAAGRLRALGTRFSVRMLGDAAQVSVFQGAVEMSPADGAPATVLQAGEQRTLHAAGSGPATPASTARQAWSQGLLLAENMRLGDFIAELANYRRGYLDCAPEVADLRLVGVYEAADTDRTLAALAATLPVRIHAPLPWWVRLVPR